ncbi:beta-eliminating lyase-related protein [Kitasatospora sp. NPDC002227]|uniref:threonine aldolase family protein n=1 Tax=Kitasatospora sp. NPDC002227 TaxID=3154773 RepID=UPI00332FC181
MRERRFAARRSATRLLSGTPAQTMRELLAELAESGDLDRTPDFYGDGVVGGLEQRVADLLGKPAAAFFPTGTMAQQVALRLWATGSGVVAMHPLAHPEQHERQAYSRLSGLHSVWPTTEPRLPTPAELRSVGEPFDVLMLELPLREAGFVLPSWAELTETVAAARELGVKVHFDGARLWESTRHFDRSLPEIAALADSVYVSFYKSLGGQSGAVLAGDEAFVAAARTWRHRYGGNLFQQWPTALSALAGLDRELPRLDAYAAHAVAVARVLAAAPGGRVQPAVPHTHQFQFWLPYPPETLNEATLKLAEETGDYLFHTWIPSALPGLSMTEITVAGPALEWTPEQITDSLTRFLALL